MSVSVLCSFNGTNGVRVYKVSYENSSLNIQHQSRVLKLHLVFIVQAKSAYIFFICCGE